MQHFEVATYERCNTASKWAPYLRVRNDYYCTPSSPQQNNNNSSDDDRNHRKRKRHHHHHHREQQRTIVVTPWQSSPSCFRLCGRNMLGQSVAVHVWNFDCYFYVRVPRALTDADRAHFTRLPDAALEALCADAKQWFNAVVVNTYLASLVLPSQEEEDARQKQLPYWPRRAQQLLERHARQWRSGPPCMPVVDVQYTEHLPSYGYHERVGSFLRVVVDNAAWVSVLSNAVREIRDGAHSPLLAMAGGGSFLPPPPPMIGEQTRHEWWPHVDPQKVFVDYDDVFEANVDDVLRLMIDTGMQGQQWISVPTEYDTKHHAADAGLYTYYPNNNDDDNNGRGALTTCDIELHADYRSIVVDHTQNNNVAPPRHVASFDIEVAASEPGRFPRAEDDPVIQIACHSEPHTHDMLFGLREHAPLPRDKFHETERTLRWYNDERELLLAFRNYFVEVLDPDIVTGYNVADFDWPYLMRRAEVLGIGEQFSVLGRVRGERSRVRETVFENKAFGRRVTKHTSMSGRTQIDMIAVMRREHKFRSYKLDYVSQQLLGEQKEDVHHTEIAVLWNGTAENRLRLALYCYKDAILPWRLMHKTMVVVRFVETARVCGVPVAYLTDKGQQIKVFSQFLRATRQHGFLVPTMTLRLVREHLASASSSSSSTKKHKFFGDDDDDDDDDDYDNDDDDNGDDDDYDDDGAIVSRFFTSKKKQQQSPPPSSSSSSTSTKGYKGATVVEPVRGFYQGCIATLDFASLYPSIMQAHNLCYTTLIEDRARARDWMVRAPDQVVCTPNGDYFVTPLVRTGILTTILKNILAARAQAKRDMKSAADSGDSDRAAVMDGRQLALKVSANSVYGFTGATVGKLPCLPIPASVTAYGRLGIEMCQRIIERDTLGDPALNPYGSNRVIYGDTDSVMIYFGNDQVDVREARDIAKRLAAHINTHFRRPMSLEFEKVFKGYLLINKKRYAGWHFESPRSFDSGIADKINAKGIESVRRDNCLLVARSVDTILRQILAEHNVQAAIDYIQATTCDLARNNVDMSALVISKAYSKEASEYKGKQPHVELARRIAQRSPDIAYKIGERIPYVVVASGLRNAKTFEKAEDPLWALEHNLAVDSVYYTEQQLKKPLMRIMVPVIAATRYGRHPLREAEAHQFDDPKSELYRQVEQLLFAPARAIKVMPHLAIGCGGGRGAPTIDSWVQRQPLCWSCRKNRVRNACSDAALCLQCATDRAAISAYRDTYVLGTLMERYRAAEAHSTLLWEQCRICLSETQSDPDKCRANTCTIFYRRHAARQRAQGASRELEDIFQTFF